MWIHRLTVPPPLCPVSLADVDAVEAGRAALREAGGGPRPGGGPRAPADGRPGGPQHVVAP